LVNVWNSLPNQVVNAADITNTFTIELDKFWPPHAVKFHFKEELTGTGNRSEYHNEISAFGIILNYWYWYF